MASCSWWTRASGLPPNPVSGYKCDKASYLAGFCPPSPLSRPSFFVQFLPASMFLPPPIKHQQNRVSIILIKFLSSFIIFVILLLTWIHRSLFSFSSHIDHFRDKLPTHCLLRIATCYGLSWTLCLNPP